MSVDESTEELKTSNEEFKKNLAHYRQVMSFLGANVPIEVLCLPKRIESALIREGFIRVYDLIRIDFREIKGVGKVGSEVLASRLDEFFTVSI